MSVTLNFEGSRIARLSDLADQIVLGEGTSKRMHRIAGQSEPAQYSEGVIRVITSPGFGGQFVYTVQAMKPADVAKLESWYNEPLLYRDRSGILDVGVLQNVAAEVSVYSALDMYGPVVISLLETTHDSLTFEAN